ncbi:unnamed protein product [Lampetra fluviatilis]
MELGRTKMPRCGANALRKALHPVHGLAWTDGRRVMLACLRLLGASPTTGPVSPASTTSCSLLDNSIIGTFEHVRDLCWGAFCCPGSAALLAVQHKRHATVWLLRHVGQLPSDPAAKGYDPCANLLVSQTCEVAVRQPILPQGCVWHPNSDALALLTGGEAWLLPAARQGNSRIRVPLQHHQHHQQQQHQHQLRHPCCPQAVRCAAWSDGGRRLVVAAGDSIFLYEWHEARRSLSPFATCPIFHLGGFASAALPVGGSLLAVALEAPGLAAVAAAPTPWPHNKTAGERLASSQVSLAPAVEPGIEEMKALPGHPRHRSSADLCHCVESANSLAAGPPPSTLLLVSFDGSSHGTCATRRVLMPGLAVPDLVAFEPRSATLALASNAAGLVLLFTLGPLGSVVASGSVRLASEEKVKGMCFFGDRTLLLASGRLCQGDAPLVLSSPPSSTSSPEPFSYTSKYSMRILARDLPTPRAAEDERSASIQSTVSSSRSSLNYMQVSADSKGEDDICAPLVVECEAGPPTPGDSEATLPRGIRSARAGEWQGHGQEHATSQTYFTRLLVNGEHPSGGKLMTSPRPLGSHPRLHHDSSDHLGSHGDVRTGPASECDRAGPTFSPLLRSSVCDSLNSLFVQLRQNVQRLNSNVAEVTVHLADRPKVPTSPISTAAPLTTPRCPLHHRTTQQQQQHRVRASAVVRNSPPGCVAKGVDDARGGGGDGSPRSGVRAAQVALLVDERSVTVPEAERAQWVRVTCQGGSDGNETGIFLLAGGRLHLGVVKEVFALRVVEIQVGETWMIIGGDENNLIPLTFDPGAEVVVREGRRRVWHGTVTARNADDASSEA